MGVKDREISNYVDCDVISPGWPLFEKETVKSWPLFQPNPRFLLKLASERFQEGLANFDPSAREMPPRHIGVAHEENAFLFIDDDAAYAERQRPRYENSQAL